MRQHRVTPHFCLLQCGIGELVVSNVFCNALPPLLDHLGEGHPSPKSSSCLGVLASQDLEKPTLAPVLSRCDPGVIEVRPASRVPRARTRGLIH